MNSIDLVFVEKFCEYIVNYVYGESVWTFLVGVSRKKDDMYNRNFQVFHVWTVIAKYRNFEYEIIIWVQNLNSNADLLFDTLLQLNYCLYLEP